MTSSVVTSAALALNAIEQIINIASAIENKHWIFFMIKILILSLDHLVQPLYGDKVCGWIDCSKIDTMPHWTPLLSYYYQ